MNNIEEDIKKVSERFNNGTETIEDILKYCRNFKFTFENGIKLQLVEKKYLDRLIEEYKKLLAEREEDKKRIEELEGHQEKFYNGELYTAKQLKQIKENQKKYFINKQKVKDNIEKHKIAKEGLEKEYNNKKYEDDDLRASDFYGIVTQDRIIQVLEKLLEDK